MMSHTERAALLRLASTPAEWNSAEWNSARGSLANAVPDLLSDLEQLRRTAVELAGAVGRRDTDAAMPALLELRRVTEAMGEEIESGPSAADTLDRVRELLTNNDWSGVLYDNDVLAAIAEAVGVDRQD